MSMRWSRCFSCRISKIRITEDRSRSVPVWVSVQVSSWILYQSNYGDSYVNALGTYPVITYHTVTLNVYKRSIKRSMDIIGSLVGIILSSPIMLIAAIAIKLDSPGPVIFKQTRVGKNGRHFTIYKFRTMCQDAEKKKAELQKENEVKSDLMFKMENDPRITKVGAFLRKTSIDELPQFFNILFRRYEPGGEHVRRH